MHEIVSAVITNRIIQNTLLHLTASWDDLEWKRNFLVNRATFRYSCTSLGMNLQRTSTLRTAISVEKRTAIALWRLGANVEYRTISHFLGVGISTACIIVHEVCKVIVTVDCVKNVYQNSNRTSGSRYSQRV